MPNPLSFSLSEYPSLAKLINGQGVTLKMRVKAGSKTLTGQGEYITIHPEGIDLEEEQKMNISDILLASLASIDKSLSMQSTATP